MKNLILILFSLLLISGCGGRKVALKALKKSGSTNTSETKETKQKELNDSEKVQSVEQNTKTVLLTTGWKYSAPPIFPGIDPCNIGLIKPFWIMTATGDSIDVSLLPSGSTLETNQIKEDSESKFKSQLSEKERKIKELEDKLSKKAKVEYVEKIKLKEVERQSIQWILVGFAFAGGVFIPGLIKWIFKLIKPKIL